MIRLAVRCRPEGAEAVLAELLALAPGGLEEARGPGYVEYALYGPPGELPELPELRAAVGGELVAIETEEVPDDWADRWRDFHRPIRLGGGRLVVRPPWEPADGAAELDVVIDPGRAFGTGSHATTRACLELLLGLHGEGRARGPLADWGTGSGVLAIVAARLGWEPVAGCDHERAALEAATANAERNGVRLSTARVNLRERLPDIAPAATVTANLTAPLLVAVAALLAAAPARPATMILSGLLSAEAERVEAAFAAAGMRRAGGLEVEGWGALLLHPR